LIDTFWKFSIWDFRFGIAPQAISSVFENVISGFQNRKSKIQNGNKPTGKLLSRQLTLFKSVVASHHRFGSFGTALGYYHAFLRFLLFNQTFH